MRDGTFEQFLVDSILIYSLSGNLYENLHGVSLGSFSKTLACLRAKEAKISLRDGTFGQFLVDGCRQKCGG